MKSRIWLMGMGLCCMLGGAWHARAATYYVNDGSTANDVYTSAAGNDLNSGTAAFPKLTIGNVIGTCNLQPGDVVYIDTGTYAPHTISNTVVGAAGNPIVFQGSTNIAVGGTTITGSGYLWTILAKYTTFRDIRCAGGSVGMTPINSAFCAYERVSFVSNTTYGVMTQGPGAASNVFRRCTLAAPTAFYGNNGLGNRFESCVLLSTNGFVIQSTATTVVTNMTGCIVVGQYGFAGDSSVPSNGSRNVFFLSGGAHPEFDALAELERRNPNWQGNTYADPLFANQSAMDFHLQSAAGFISNGVWTTAAAGCYSPAIDFGAGDDAAWINELEPNGGRVNVGLYGGTAEASKSRTGPWLFAASFNDGGNLVRTGRLAWVASTNLASSTVDLQFSTNNGATWSNIATGVAATSETYAAWAPADSHPAVLWRVVCSTNAAISATNSKAFSIRATNNAAFSFYVNDDSTVGDVYCSAIGIDTNSGAATNAPKRSLKAILDAYDLEAGDTVYVDTGNFATTITVTITATDSGTTGVPVRIVGSANGAVLGSGSTSLSAMEANGARNLEISGLRLAGPGLAGFTGSGMTNVVLRNVVSTGNRWGYRLLGSAARNVFEGCLAADNEWGAFSAVDSQTRSNLWSNGAMWGNPTNVLAHTNAPLAVSNSILGNASVLFAGAVVPGNYNVVWNTGVGLTYSTFSALQNAGLGWERSLYADPLFANASGGDYHLKSLSGRYSTNTHAFVTNDAVHSPAIDFGDPLAAVSNEPAPNGGRRNAGMFGGTAQASKSRTNAWLQTLSYMDGGTLDAAAGSWLRWDGGGYASTSTVTLWLSRDNGFSWEVLATNLWATNGEYFCQNLSTNDPSSPYALWKVALDEDTNVFSRPATNFTYRNGAFTFYVNDASLAGDIYCTAIGNDGNLGVSAGSPKANLHAVIEAYKLGPGDRVYVDTGAYVATNVITLTTQDSGVATNPVVIAGSTNRAAGGSVFGLAGSGMRPLGFIFQNSASNIVLRDMALTNMARGVVVTNSTGLTLDGVEVRGGAARAFELQGNARNVDLVRCVAHGGGVGVYLNQASNVTIRHCVFWQNLTNAIYAGSQVGVAISNSVMATTNAGAVLYSIATQAWFSADYNGLHAGSLARVGLNRTTGSMADDLAAWQRLAGGRDAHSVPGDPQLGDPSQYDYHPKTEQTLGRRLPNGLRTSDSVTSPLIDAGSPDEGIGEEPEPNGGRVNIGKYGGTWEASIAPATPWLRTITFGDAGSVTNGAVSLRWTAGGGFSNETVKVDVSVDGGRTWAATVASNVPATNGAATWTVAGLPDTPAGAWRVICENDETVFAQATNFFAIRNNPLNIYLATADTNETVYTTAPGAADNWQATSNAPLNSLRLAFERFDLEAGDRIWVDTGRYAESAPVWIGLKDSGTSSNPVQVVGNTQRPFDAAILSRVSRTLDAIGVQFVHAQGVTFDSLMVSNAFSGIQADNSQAVTLERMRIGYCVTNAVFAGASTHLVLSHAIVEQNLYYGLLANTGATVRVVNSLLRDNARSALFVRGGTLGVTNSILEADGSSRYVYYLGSSGSLSADFNNVRVANGASVAWHANTAYRFLIDWQGHSTNDMSSFGYEPMFADENDLDFHLQSAYGRFDPALGVFVTNDVETSRLIDLGCFESAYANEPPPNGGRINVGLYGDTDEASKSSSVGTLVPLTMSDGGTIRGEATLYWAYNGIADNAWVNILFSADGGSNWTPVATNQYADLGRSGLPWITTNFPSTAMGVWRVELVADTNVYGQTETLFAIKNEPLAYYINDGATAGDIYCADAGSAANTGLSSNSPLDSLEVLLGRYKVEPGDTVYVDTGVYPRTSPLVISAPASGATNFLIVQGSTNFAAGGSVFTNSSGGAVIDLQSSHAVELRDLQLHGGGKGLLFTESSDNRIWRVRSVGARGNAFELGTRSDQNRFIQCAALNFSSTGFHVVRPALVEIPPATNLWINGVIAPLPVASNGVAPCTGALMGAMSGRVYVSNSVFVANSYAYAIYAVAPDAIRGDYNCYHCPYSNLIASVDLSAAFGLDRMDIDQLGAWSLWNQSDSNSLAADPQFADLSGGDLHPRSAGGRFLPAVGGFTNDVETSPLIDTADPALEWSGESEPNGRRANLGVYGNDPQASRTPTNGTFVLLDFNQGGVARGMQTLRWIARGAAFTTAVYTVNVQLSTNSGASYDIALGTNLATAGSLAWNTAAYPSLSTVRWRVQCREKIAWSAASERDFTIHNTNIVFYVNDLSTSNDVYSAAPGGESNSGLSPDSPLASVADVLARYDLEPGDRVLIDTGSYDLDAPLEFGLLDSGTAVDPVIVQGSTNHPGSVFRGMGIRIGNARGLALRNVQFADQTSSHDVATIASSEDVALEKFDVYGASAGGVKITTCSNVVLRNFIVANAKTNGVMCLGSYNTRLEFGTIWSNGLAQVLARNQLLEDPRPEREASFATVSNCILGSFGLRIPAFEVRGTLYADFNDFYLANGALAALSYLTGFGREFDTVGSWASSEFGQDGRSLSHNPRFAGVGAKDFHLKSTAGRWVPASATWTNDLETSPLIDAADPIVDSGNEPAPNGGRANIGRYGNDGEASRTPTNGALTLISFNDGGRASGAAVPILWNARGEITNGTVSIYYSADGGLNWTELATNVAAFAGSWSWDSTLSAQSVQGQLRIVGSDGSTATSQGYFSVRNAPFQFYVNDGVTSNDVYCTAAGQGANSGLSSNAPMSDLNALLTKYDLESGDTVYIDTGVYKGNDPWRITQADSAGSLDVDPVVFQGSTYSLTNGTVLDRSANSIGIQADFAVGIRLRNVAVINTKESAVVLNDCYGADAEWMAVGNANLAFHLFAGSQMRVAHSLVYDANKGVHAEYWNLATNTVFPVIEHNVFWDMATNAVQVSGNNKATARNNLMSVRPEQYVYQLGGGDEIYADYNAIWLGDGGRVFRRDRSAEESPVPLIYDTVGKWAAATSNDLHSYDGDPLVANAETRDFHLRSQAGRLAGTNWVADAVTSPLIDAGDPSGTDWTNEPAPHAERVNIGLFGGSPQASMSATNSALYLLTLNRGGVVSGQVSLNWMAAGLASGHTVRVEISIDDGAHWILVGAGIPADIGGVSWNSANQPSSALGLWRVLDEEEPGVGATSEFNFVLHNGPVIYYVNDDFTEGDVYCSAAGSSTNAGTSSDSPKRWISEILDAYNLEAGDVVYVDTGRYQTAEPTVLGDLDAGDTVQNSTRQVNIVGSTNVLAGGSLYLLTDPTASAFQLDGTYGVRISHLGIMAASNGLAISNSFYVAGEWLEISGCENGAQVLSSSEIWFNHAAMVGNESGVYFYDNSDGLNQMRVDSCMLWSNRYGIYLARGYAAASNTVFGMVASNSFGYYMLTHQPPVGFAGDFNNLYVGAAGSAVGALQTGVGSVARTSVYSSVSSWAAGMGQDAHSLAHDPRLADPGNGDYHLRSSGGRRAMDGSWVYDSDTSPLIDSGDPASTAWLQEPDPNGRRLNIGLYGGSAEASKTALAGTITLISLNDGGSAAGEVDLQWTVGGAASNYTVCLDYSPDNGDTWTNIVCGVPAVWGRYLWDSLPYGRSALALWRAYCVENPDISATSIAAFTLRNEGSIPYYVNDASTNGDVFCTAVGNDANSGLSPHAPKASLQMIFDEYELAPQDVVYVDAGNYVVSTPPIKIDQTDSGWSNLYVTVQGSTNPAAATRFTASSFSMPYVLALQYAVNVRLKDLTIRNAKIGLDVSHAIGCELDGVRIENNLDVGLNLYKSENIHMVRSVLWKNEGASATGGVAAALIDSSLAADNCALWGSPTALSIISGSLTVTNSVLDAKGTDGRIYLFFDSAHADTGFHGDYNNYVRRNGALICEQRTTAGGSDFYNNLPAWALVNGSDQHSLTLDPAFADEAGGDFHPKSTRGRFVASNGTWTVDATNSPLIDSGAPNWPCTNELAPNGGYVNIGIYGNTRQASLTQTNPPWLRAVSYNDEGVLAGTVKLYWLHGGMPAGARVNLEYSTDAQISWHAIATNLLAASREYDWDVGSLPLSLGVNWRVVYEGNTNIWDASDVPRPIDPGKCDFYVNDASTDGDVWCAGPGLPCDDPNANPTNRATPVDSLACLLASYPIDAGDRIYIDTGTYPITQETAAVIDDGNMGTAEDPLIIYGSTNYQAGGALFLGDNSINGLELQNTRYVEIHDLRVASNRNGVALQNVSMVALVGLEAFGNRTNGVWSSGSSGVELRNARLWNNRQYGLVSTAAKGAANVLNSTLWGNTRGAVKTTLSLSVSNSILGGTNAAPICSEDGLGAVVWGDYNMFGVGPGGKIGTNSSERVNYANLRQWQNKGRDMHSLVTDPLFVDAALGNFHLRSRAGYWNNGAWVPATNTSWAIDAGDPAATGATNELSPNGARINLGAYGGTPQASKSDASTAEFLASTMRDGGVAPDGQALYWLYRGMAATNTARLEYSPDGGASWQLIANGVSIGSTPYYWFSTGIDPSPEALWRIVLTADDNVVDTTLVPFTYRPVPLTYYVNDASQAGDVFTTAIGATSNRGYQAGSPLPSVHAVLNRFQLTGGDGIKVDTGTYPMSTSIVLSVLTSGDSTNRVYVVGSTNDAAGGTWFQDASGGKVAAFELNSAHDINISDFRLTGFSNGVSFAEYNYSCAASNLDVQGSSGPGILVNLSPAIRLSHVLVRDGMTNGIDVDSSQYLAIDSCVIWSNRASALYLGESVQLAVSNSVLHACGSGNYCYESPTNVGLVADYNDVLATDSAQISTLNGMQYEKLPQWALALLQDRHSLSTDPLFHDPANGDFHLRSAAGRYQSGAGWVQDEFTGANDYSPLIDMGAPRATWSNEPAPNGNRRNIGLYGDTPQASLSNTNQWLLAVTAMSGGILSGSFNLTWGYGGIPSNAWVQLAYSYDNGMSDWKVIDTVLVGSGEYLWQSDLKQGGGEVYQTSPGARWRIVLLDDTNVWDMTDLYFGLHNSPFKYYLNDTSTVGDVYCTAPGDDLNLGFYPAAPKLTLNNLLDEMDLEGTDIVYIDTGDHWMEDTNTPVRWMASDGGTNGLTVLVRGSTNVYGSRFITTNAFKPGASESGYFFMEAGLVDMRDVRFEGESITFRGGSLVVSNLALTNRTGGYPVAMYVHSDNSIFDNLQIDRSSFNLAGQSNAIRRLRQRWGEADIVGTNDVLRNSVVFTTNAAKTALVVDAVSALVSNCTVVSTRGTAIGKGGYGSLRLVHNILVAGGGVSNAVVNWIDGGLVSDWNDLLARDGAWVGVRNGKWEKLSYWQAASGQDANSVSFDPIFADEMRGDMHLKSEVGRWDPLINAFRTDPGYHSPVIDLGNPMSSAGAEAWPDWGYRLNLGAYGGTTEASKSRSDFWLTALTLNDGGVAKGTNVVLRWATGNAAGKLVTLQYSTDGLSWANIATGVTALAGTYAWDTTGFTDGFNAYWRVIAEDGSDMADQTDSTFALRNAPQNFYVNDGDLNGDVYCSAVGSVANDGLTAGTPKAHLQQILDAYDLEGGDVVHLDSGTYVANADTWVIWSRSGSTNADVVIKGITNNPFSAVLARSGPTNYPAAGIDVRASHLQLRDMEVRGVNRGIVLESNQNVTVQGVVVGDATTGLEARGAQGTTVRNSAFWRTGIGVSLINAQTSTLENLTFALSTVAGVHLQNTGFDVLQNNVFIPAEDACAYSIGTATSLLQNATMDYNLYDFVSHTNTGFFAGGTNYYSGPTNDPMRRWQLAFGKDYRSTIAPADLADPEFDGDFHPKSTVGRWSAGGWVQDETNSWAIDHGHPSGDASREPEPNGARLNVGMFGNTEQASLSSTNVYFEARTMNEAGFSVTSNDQTWVWAWFAHLVDSNETVAIQFSGDCGETWTTLTNVDAYQEYYVWRASPEFQTAGGSWRVIGNSFTNLWDANDYCFLIRYRDLGILTRPYPVSGLMRFEWEGGIQGRRYEIRYSDDFGKTWQLWEEKYNGPARINKSNFVIPVGGSQLSYTFEDRTSYLHRQRWYRIYQFDE